MASMKKIIELVEQSKGWSAVEASRDNAENVMMGIEEEIYNIPTVEYVHRRGGFMIMPFTVYHVAFHALADLRNIEMHKKHSVSSVVLGKDTFAVTVYPHVDYAFIVGLVVILDNQ